MARLGFGFGRRRGRRLGAPTPSPAPTITSSNPSGTFDEGVGVGGTLTANQTVTWSKSGSDAAKVTLNASTGVWSLEPTDFETKTSYGFTFTGTNVNGTASQSVVIAIANVNETGLPSTSAVQTSTPGTSPYAFGIAFPTTIFAGDFLNIQRSADGAKTGANYTTPTLQVQHILTLEDIDNMFISQAELDADGWLQPTGEFHEMYWFSNGAGEEGPRTEITDTIAAYTATFSASLKNSHVALYNGNRRMIEEPIGNAACACEGNTPLSAATGYFEFTLVGRDGWPGASNGEPGYVAIIFGVVDEEDFTTALGHSAVDAAGVGFNSFGYSYTGGAFIEDTGHGIGAGDHVGFLVHKDSRKVWPRRSDGVWVSGTPKFNSDQTLHTDSTGGLVLPGDGPIHPCAAGSGFQTTIDINCGQDAFALGALPTNAKPGWA